MKKTWSISGMGVGLAMALVTGTAVAESTSEITEGIVMQEGVFYTEASTAGKAYYGQAWVTPIPVTADSPCITGGGPRSEGEMAWLLTEGIQTANETASANLVYASDYSGPNLAGTGITKAGLAASIATAREITDAEALALLNTTTF